MNKIQIFLVIGDEVVDILNPTDKWHKVFDFHYAINNLEDESGKVTSHIENGVVQVTLSSFAPKEIKEWALTPGKSQDCTILVFDEKDKLLDKTILKQAVCVNLQTDFNKEREIQVLSKFDLRPKKLVVADGIEFEN